MKILVISSDYPRPDFIYGDVFVHSRLKQYRQLQEDVSVIGYNSTLSADHNYVYEGVPSSIVRNIKTFYGNITAFNPDIIVAHLINHTYIEFLIDLKKPIIIFAHGYEATSWRRRLMNYNTIGSIRYLIPYIRANRIQLSKLKLLATMACSNAKIHFVFVSHWLKNAVQDDLRIKILNSSVIPNGIDTSLFIYHPKQAYHRKKYY
jgi:hypothetical protein